MEPQRTSTDRRMRRLTERRRFRPALRRTPRLKVLGAVAVVLVALALWTAFDLRSARRELISARAELSAAAADLGTATDANAAATLRRATQHAVTRTENADRRVHRSPALRVAGVVPGISTQRDGLYRAVRAARDAARIGDALAAVAQRQGEGLTVRSGTVDLAAVQALAAAAERAGAALAAIPDTHRDAQWGPLGNATRELDELVADTATRLTHGSGVMQLVADLLGAQGPKRVFIALLNNAEMRDQGMVLSYVVAETADGGFHVTRSGSVIDLELPSPVTDVVLPDGTRRVFGALAPTRIWQSVNATADTALSGALMRSMYRAATGDSVDAVVALDVPALSALLTVTGPVQVTGITQPITADNAAQVLLDDLYQVGAGADFHDARQDRLEQLAATVDAVINRIRSSPVNGTSLVRALGGAARGGHTWVSTADPVGQRALERAGLSGAPGDVHPERTIHVSVQNGTATKLDWFVDPRVDVAVSVTEDGTAVVRTTVTLPNTAPVPTPSSEQFGPDNLVTRIAGLYRGRVYFWGPSTGDQLDSVVESGLRLNFNTAEVPAGGTGRVTFSTVIPKAVQDGVLRLRFVPQARARPMTLRVTVTGVGWDVQPATRTMAWDRTFDLEWMLRSG